MDDADDDQPEPDAESFVAPPRRRVRGPGPPYLIRLDELDVLEHRAHAASWFWTSVSWGVMWEPAWAVFSQAKSPVKYFQAARRTATARSSW